MAITINQLAELCGVSRGTVDRALHNKGNVRPEVADKIKHAAQEYGYTPNRAGMALSRASRPIRIGVVMHSTQTPFMQLVLNVCRREAIRLAAFSVKVIFRLSLTLDPIEQVSMIDKLVEQHHINGLAVAALHSTLVEHKINELIEKRHIPVVMFNTDLPSSKRLCYIGQDNFAAGRTSAELMRLLTRGEGIVSPIIGPQEYHFAYSERLSGFQSELAHIAPNIQLYPVHLHNDADACAKAATLSLLRRVPNLSGIYAITPGYAGICDALQQTNRTQDVHLIMHDEINANLHHLQEGVADFVIGQDAELQGALPLRVLTDWIQLQQRPSKSNIYTDVRVLLRYNINNLL